MEAIYLNTIENGILVRQKIRDFETFARRHGSINHQIWKPGEEYPKLNFYEGPVTTKDGEINYLTTQAANYVRNYPLPESKSPVFNKPSKMITPVLRPTATLNQLMKKSESALEFKDGIPALFFASVENGEIKKEQITDLKKFSEGKVKRDNKFIRHIANIPAFEGLIGPAKWKDGNIYYSTPEVGVIKRRLSVKNSPSKQRVKTPLQKLAAQLSRKNFNV